MWLFCTTRHGVSGKEPQRQLGVTYKTAYRMRQQISALSAKADSFDTMLSGHIELDETYVDGRARDGARDRGASNKALGFALAERNGRIGAKVVANAQTVSLRRSSGTGGKPR